MTVFSWSRVLVDTIFSLHDASRAVQMTVVQKYRTCWAQKPPEEEITAWMFTRISNELKKGLPLTRKYVALTPPRYENHTTENSNYKAIFVEVIFTITNLNIESRNAFHRETFIRPNVQFEEELAGTPYNSTSRKQTLKYKNISRP